MYNNNTDNNVKTISGLYLYRKDYIRVIPLSDRKNSFNYLSTYFTMSESARCAIALNSTVFCTFLDIKRAFDSVWREGLTQKHISLGIKGPLLLIINQCHTDMKSAVLLNGITSSWFPVDQGVRQGGVLSTFLHNLYIDNY